MLDPKFLALWQSSLALRSRFFYSHLHILQNFFEFCMLSQDLLNLTTAFTCLGFALARLVDPFLDSLEEVIPRSLVHLIHEYASLSSRAILA